MVLLYIAKKFTISKNLIKWWKFLIFLEFYYFFTGIASTVVKGGLRVIWALIGNLFSIFRVDKPVVSGRYLALDEAYNVYAGLLLMYHYNNNPILITFLNIIT